MIEPELRNKIRRMYFVDHLSIHSICSDCGVHRDTVANAIKIPRKERDKIGYFSPLVAPFEPLIKTKLNQYPSMKSTRLIQILRDQGYQGSINTLRRHIKLLKQLVPPRHVFLKMEVVPGEQGQVDWAHFGTIKVGEAVRKLYLFIMVLSWSRIMFGRFVMSMKTNIFLELHRQAFEFFEGVPQIILYDNLKSAVLARRGSEIRFNPELLEFSGFYNYEPRACAPFKGNQKGRVERAIRYCRDNFFCGREFKDIADLNQQFDQWLGHVANRRPWPDNRSVSIDQKWEEEKPRLLQRGEQKFFPKERVAVRTKKTLFIRYDLNSYSIPKEYVNKNLTLEADLHSIEIYYGAKLLVIHPRCWERGQLIKEAEHIDELIKAQKKPSLLLYRTKLETDFPLVKVFLDESFKLGHSTAKNIKGMERLLKDYDHVIFELSLEQTVSAQSFTLAALRHFINQTQRDLKSPPKVSVDLPANSQVRDLEIKPHNPSIYDQLGE